MNLRQWFDLTFGPRANQEALEWAGQVYTFGDIDARSNRMARALQARSASAAKAIRHMCLPVEWHRDHRSLSRLCEARRDLRADQHCNCHRDREDVAHPERRRAQASRYGKGDSSVARGKPSNTLAAKPSRFRPDRRRRGRPCLHLPGQPRVSKGAMLTHNNFAVNAANLIEAWRIVPQDRFLLAPPLFHVHALGNGLHCWLFAGCRTRLLERFDHTTAVSQLL